MTKPPIPPPTGQESRSPVTRRATVAWVVLILCVLLGVALFVVYGRDLLPLTNSVP